MPALSHRWASLVLAQPGTGMDYQVATIIETIVVDQMLAPYPWGGLARGSIGAAASPSVVLWRAQRSSTWSARRSHASAMVNKTTFRRGSAICSANSAQAMAFARYLAESSMDAPETAFKRDPSPLVQMPDAAIGSGFVIGRAARRRNEVKAAPVVPLEIN